MSESSLESRLSGAFATLLGLLPPLVILFLIRQHAVNVPFHDEWEWSVRRVLHGDLDSLNLGAFWELKNEHRVFLPTLIGTALARWSNMNMLWPIYLKVGLTFASLLCLRAVYRSNTELAEPPRVFVPLSVLIFSMAQWPRWMDVRPLPSTLSTLGFVAALWLVGAGRVPAERRLPRFLGALVCAWISSSSYFSGNVAWFALLVLLHVSGWSRRWIVAWGVCMFAVWIDYFADFFAVESPTTRDAGGSPLAMLRFFLIFLGSSCSTASRGALDQTQAMGYGLIGLLLTVALAWRITRGIEGGRRQMLPWLCLSCWVLANAGAAAFGRVASAGDVGGRAWRYTVFGGLFWLALCMLGVVAVREPVMRARASTRSLGYLALAVVTVGAVGGVLGMLDSGGLTGYKNKLEAGRRNLLLEEGRNRFEIGPLHPDPGKLYEVLPELIERRASFLYGERALRSNDAEIEGAARSLRRSYGSRAAEVVSIRAGSRLTWRLRVLDRPFAYFSCGLAGDPGGSQRTVSVRVADARSDVELAAVTFVPTDQISEELKLDLRAFADRDVALTVTVSGRGHHRIHLVDPAVIYDVLDRPRP